MNIFKRLNAIRKHGLEKDNFPIQYLNWGLPHVWSEMRKLRLRYMLSRGLQLGEGVDGDNPKSCQVDGKARRVDSQKMSSLGCRLPSPAQSRNMASCML